jgi:hypothetical protein
MSPPPKTRDSSKPPAKDRGSAGRVPKSVRERFVSTNESLAQDATRMSTIPGSDLDVEMTEDNVSSIPGPSRLNVNRGSPKRTLSVYKPGLQMDDSDSSDLDDTIQEDDPSNSLRNQLMGWSEENGKRMTEKSKIVGHIKCADDHDLKRIK